MQAPLATTQDAAAWLRARGALRLVTNSRELRSGDAFLAWPGRAFDARNFVSSALASGAVACLVESAGAEPINDPRVQSFAGLKALVGLIAADFYSQPSAALDVLAITGTNGKTSSAFWIAQMLSALQRRCGVIGTLGVGEPGRLEATGLTTPDAVLTQTTLRRMVDAGFEACAIEASSIGMIEQRLAGTRVRVAVFTNFTQDHLDYHGSMEAYWAAKRALFAWPGLQAAVLNIDDPKGAELSHEVRGLDLWTFGVERSDARLAARDVHYRPAGLAFTLVEGGNSRVVETALIGDYNVANLLGVIAALRALGLPFDDCVQAASQVAPVPGRMQCVGNGLELPLVVVDYAHTPDALEKALGALRNLALARGGKLLCVFGCGGDRDRQKRPLMGAIAARLADRVLLTSDNPRSESPAQILADIAVGAPLAAQEPERAAAISRAVLDARSRDVVLLAGKGHEDYQEIDGVRRPFSDVEEARAALIRRAGL